MGLWNRNKPEARASRLPWNDVATSAGSSIRGQLRGGAIIRSADGENKSPNGAGAGVGKPSIGDASKKCKKRAESTNGADTLGTA